MDEALASHDPFCRAPCNRPDGTVLSQPSDELRVPAHCDRMESTSNVAACCSRASLSSRASRAIFVPLLKAERDRLRAGCCAFAGLWFVARCRLTLPSLG